MIHNFIFWFDNNADPLLQSILGNMLADAFLLAVPFLLLRIWQQAKTIRKIGTNMKVSPDGKHVSSEVEGEIILTDALGTRNITHSKERDIGAMWANNSRYLAYASEVKDGWQIWVKDITTNKAACMTEGAGQKRPLKWDSDGNLVVSMGGSALMIYAKEIEKRLR